MILAAPPILLGYEKKETYKALRGIGGTVNTLEYEISIANEGLRGIGDTANTLRYENKDKYEGPPGYRQYPRI